MLYFIISALIVVLDQVFKYYIASNIAFGEQMQLIPGIIHLTYIENTGAAFGIFADKRWLLVAVSAICVVVMIVVLARYKMDRWGKLGLAMVLGGAVGNLIDRVFIGYVVDMFEPEFVDFAVFNVADTFITIGGIIFVIYYIIDIIRDSKKGKKTVKSADGAESWEAFIPDDSEEDSTLTETQILEEFDMQRRMSESDDDD